MYTKDEATAERVAAYAAALVRELGGVQARIARVEAGKTDGLTLAQLKARVSDIDAELKAAAPPKATAKRARGEDSGSGASS